MPLWYIGLPQNLSIESHYGGLSLENLQIIQVDKVQRTAARWICRRWGSTNSVIEMLEWPYLEARRNRSFLFLFHKIHSGAVSIEKDK